MAVLVQEEGRALKLVGVSDDPLFLYLQLASECSLQLVAGCLLQPVGGCLLVVL